MTDIPERSIHAAIVIALRRLLPTFAVLHHSPNEGKRGRKAQADLKALGVCAGWPDLEIGYKGRMIFIEVKAKGGSVSAAQRDTHRTLEAAGFIVLLVNDADDAIAGVCEWLDSLDG